MKFAIRTIVLLLVINVVLVYMQYIQMADAWDAQESKEHEVYSQEIEVINREHSLVVRHTFENLGPERAEIIWPKDSVNRKCDTENDASCSRLNESLIAFSKGEEETQSITYEIPKKAANKDTMFFQEPFAAIRNALPETTTMHLTDETNSGGIWISGLNWIGTKQMEMIEYSLYKGDGQITDLYWQKEVLPIAYKGNALTVYGQNLDGESYEGIDQLLTSFNVPNLTVVQRNRAKDLHSDRFVITGQPPLENETPLLKKAIRFRYTIPENEILTGEIAASILNGSPVGTEKTKKLFTDLTAGMTDEEMVSLRESLQSKPMGARLHAAMLDEAIGKVADMNTSFIRNNLQGSFPFLFEDPRQIIVGGEPKDNIASILKDGKKYYPAKELFAQFGYDVTSNDRSLYVQNDDEMYRFSLRDPFYVHEDKKHTVTSMPYEKIGGRYYFEENALRRIFHLIVQEKQDSIVIEQTVI